MAGEDSRNYIIEGSLEVKLPTIWRDEKHLHAINLEPARRWDQTARNHERLLSPQR
jgi:hypothetical protein